MLDRSELLRELGIDGDVPRLEEAMTHTSFVNEHPGARDYQRLEFLGDAVLGLCVTELLLAQAPTAREGSLTRMRASLVNTEALAAFARSANLARWVDFGRGAVTSGDASRSKVLADVVEAIVAAVYLAQGLDAARRLTRRIVGESLNSRARIARRDPKSELQERVQQGGGEAPAYEVIAVDGPEHERHFRVEVRAGGDVLGRGDGRSKKAAEQAAARAALDEIERRRDETK
jgi:ribonuclease-3